MFLVTLKHFTSKWCPAAVAFVGNVVGTIALGFLYVVIISCEFFVNCSFAQNYVINLSSIDRLLVLFDQAMLQPVSVLIP